MAKEADILFCRVAIHNKLVTKEQAQACLREAAQAGKDVGEIFRDRLLLTAGQVDQIWQAVERVGQRGGAGRRAAPARPGPKRERPRRPAAGRARGAPRAPRRAPPPDEPPPRRRVQRQDPARLAVVIGSLVALVGLIIALVVVLTPSGKTRSPAEAVRGERTKRAAPKRAAAVPGASSPAAAAPVKPQLTKEESARLETDVNKVLSDARMFGRDGLFNRGIERIDRFIQNNDAQLGDESRSRLQAEKERLQAHMAEKAAEYEGKIKEAAAEGNSDEVSNLISDAEHWADAETVSRLRKAASGQ